MLLIHLWVRISGNYERDVRILFLRFRFSESTHFLSIFILETALILANVYLCGANAYFVQDSQGKVVATLYFADNGTERIYGHFAHIPIRPHVNSPRSQFTHKTL